MTISDDELDREGYRSLSLDPRRAPETPLAVRAEFYLAVLVNEIVTEADDAAPLYEESCVLIKATSQEQAEQKAASHGKQQETSYRNERDQLVTWKLKHVVEVKQLDDDTFDDGTELYSRFFRNYEAYHSFEVRLSGEEL